MKKELLNKFFKGNASKSEIEQIVEYLYSNQIDKDLQVALEKELEDNELYAAYNPKNSFNKIAAEIDSTNKIKSQKPSFKILKLAATLLLLSISTFILLKFINSGSSPSVVQNNSISTIIKSTEKGQKLELKLPDGTFVILNAESQLKYYSDYGINQRKVELQGEAYFDVVKDTKSFLVDLNQIQISVLGTSFNAINRDKIPESVALVEGKVTVDDKRGNKINLKPGEMINMSDDGLQKSIFDIQQIIGWKDGWLIFEQASLESIIEKLELWYGVNILTDGESNQQYHYTGKFQNKSLEEVLNGISFVMNFNFQIDYDKVKINLNQK